MIISRKELESYPVVGSGAQSNIYKISEEYVIKLIEEKNIDLLLRIKEIELQQFVTPVEEVYDEFGVFHAMLYKYIGTKEYKSILSMDKETLIKNIETLLDDIYKLSKARILISDLIPINTLCLEDKIYIVDLDLYKIASNNLTEETILKINIQKFEQYLKKLWIIGLVNSGIDRRSIKYHPEYLEEDYLKIIYNEFDNNESIKKYIKKKVSVYGI